MTTSLELSRKLHEAGIRLETKKCYWYQFEGEWSLVTHSSFTKADAVAGRVIPAYTTDELLAWMPIREMRLWCLENPEGGKEYLVYPMGEHSDIAERASTPSEALGLLALELKKKGII